MKVICNTISSVISLVTRCLIDKFRYFQSYGNPIIPPHLQLSLMLNKFLCKITDYEVCSEVSWNA